MKVMTFCRGAAASASLALAVGGLAALCVPATAAAAFPGQNGAIAFSRAAPTGQGTTCGPEEAACDDTVSRLFALSLPSKTTSMLPTCASLDDCGEYEPVWSPDGRRLAFSRVGPGLTRQILVANADGTGARPVANGESPAWSPDADRLTFERQVRPRSAKSSVYVVGADGTRLARVTYGRDSKPVWSSRGLIAFERYSATRKTLQIWAVRPNGEAPRLLVRRSGGSPDWAPDGKRIVFQAYGKAYGITIANGSRTRRLSRSGSSPAWSPDGRRIAFTTKRGLFTVATRGKLRERQIVKGSVGFPDWQPLPHR